LFVTNNDPVDRANRKVLVENIFLQPLLVDIKEAMSFEWLSSAYSQRAKLPS